MKGEGGRGSESIILLIFFFGVALLVSGWEVVDWGRKSYLGPAEISSFSRRDLCQRNMYDSFWLAGSTGYFYILFL